MNKLAERMIRAAKLDPQLYEEVEADTTAMNQAMLVVVLSVSRPGSAAVEAPRGPMCCRSPSAR